MKVTVNLQGFQELEKALVEEFPKATSKNILTRTAKAALVPIMQSAKDHVGYDEHRSRPGRHLRDRIDIKPVKAQRTSAKKFAKQSGVTVAVGPVSSRPYGPGGYAARHEFGTVNHPANPYMRSALDGNADKTFGIVRAELAVQIEKARVRIAKKAAKKAKLAGGGA